MSTFAPTPQQQAAETAARARRDLVIRAGAGTGKTSTLVHVAKVLDTMGLVGAYLCFNGTTAREAKARFPRSVHCGTAHSFAWQAGGKWWGHRMRGRDTGRGFQNAKVVAKILGIREPLHVPGAHAMAHTTVATLALRTVKAFCKSGDLQLDVKHVPVPAYVPVEAHPQIAAAILPHARRAWEDLHAKNGLADDPSAEGCLNVEHDHYLKFWQLGGLPIMVKGPGGALVPADYVMFDEAQDAQPVMAAVFKAQGREWISKDGRSKVAPRQLILVGDRNQAINGWAGAVDIMGDFPQAAQVELTKSFRFGEAVAREANKWLDLLGADLRITGHDPIPSVVRPLAEDEHPDVILCRTGAGAVRAVLQQHEAGRSVHLVGDGEDVKAIAQACIDLEEKGRTFHQDLKDFVSWGQVVTYCEQGELGSEELEAAVNLIEEFTADTVIEAIDKLVTARAAQVTVCTAHKAKGLEWDTVKVGDDFRGPRHRDGQLEMPEDEELMLAYVTVTRAKKRLDVGSLSWIDKHTASTHPGSAFAEPVIPPAQAAPSAPAPTTATVGAGTGVEAGVAVLRARGVTGTDEDLADAVRAIVKAYLDPRPALKVVS